MSDRRPTLPLPPLPPCDHELEYIAPSAGHGGTLFRCVKCRGYLMRGEPNDVRN